LSAKTESKIQACGLLKGVDLPIRPTAYDASLLDLGSCIIRSLDRSRKNLIQRRCLGHSAPPCLTMAFRAKSSVSPGRFFLRMGWSALWRCYADRFGRCL